MIAACLVTQDALLAAVEQGVRSEMFQAPALGDVYQAMVDLLDAGQAVDFVTVSDRLQAQGKLERVGGVSALAEAADMLPTAANAEHYAAVVKAKWVRRQMIQAAYRVMELAQTEDGDLDEQAAEAERTLMAATQEQARGKLSPFGRVLLEHWERLYNSRRDPDVAGLRLGLKGLDSIMGGMRGGDLVVIAGRPSQGKTALALSIARSVAGQGKHVAFFSLEMSREALAERLVCAEATIEGRLVRVRSLAESEWNRAWPAISRMAALPIWIDDDGGVTTSEMRARARRVAVEQGLDLVIVDYLGLVKDRGDRNTTRAQQVGHMAQQLKIMARELDVPVILLSQLNRNVEQRQDKVPTLSDLRESGEIEQVADTVILVHNATGKPDSGPRELIVAKQRNGPTGAVGVYFQREYTRFLDVERLREEG